MLVAVSVTLSGAIVFLYKRAYEAEKQYVGELKSQLEKSEIERAILGGHYDSNETE